MAERQRDFPKTNKRAKRLRQKTTPAEDRLWLYLRKIEGRHFRQQASIGPHVFDFAEMSAKLVIELDGGIHELASVKARDVAKEAWAISQGFTVLRLPNAFAFGTADPALELVMSALRAADRANEQRAR